MYNVSDKFKNAIKASNRKSSIYGVLTTSNGTEHLLDNSNIIKDSLYITNQIVNNNKLTFGAVYAGECGLVINSTIDRYSLFGAKLELNFMLDLVDGTEELLPLGVFYVDTPERIGSKIKLTAVDCMSKFDTPVNEDVNGTLYELISYIADKCDVELAQTQEEIEALHINATNQNYTIQQDRIDTYRDALSFLSMVICANATIDNTGKLKIVQYATSACDSNDGSTRLNNCKFSDYTTTYAGVKTRFIADENYAPYSAVNPDIDGLILDLGDIPIVGGTSDSKNATIEAMMQTITQIAYVPATLYVASNPAYELGDMITCENVNNTADSVNTYVMAYKYDYRKKETINCYGDNPLLQNITDKSKNFNSSDLEVQIALKQIVVVNATNISDITITQEFKEIVALNFSVNSDCRPICVFTIPFSIDIDGYVEFTLYDSLMPLDNATYKGYYEKGEHFATFMYLDDMKKDTRRSMRVLAKCYADVTSATRVQDARLKAIENGWSLIVAGTPAELEPVDADITEPTTVIKALAVKAIAYTQGINNKDEWDGMLEFKDEIIDIPVISDMSVVAFEDNVSVNMQIPTPSSITEMFGEVALNSIMSVIGFTDSVSTSHIILGYVLDATNGVYNSKYVTADGAYMLKTEYNYTSTEQTIDSGRMCAVSIDITPFVNVESVVVECVYASDDVLYLVEADGKLYTVVDGALSELVTTDIVAQTFLDYGIEDIPDGALLVGLSNPEVLCWQDREDDLPSLTAIVTATPPHQVVVSQEIDLMHSSIKGISSMVVDCKGTPIFAVSFDNKSTWMKWGGTDWVDVVDELTGMTNTELEAITTEQWQVKYEVSSNIYIRCTLLDTAQSITSVGVNFIN